MPTVHVDLAERAYDVIVENGALAEVGRRILDVCPCAKAAVICDANVDRHHSAAAMESLASAGITATKHVVPAGEGSKSFTTMEKLSSDLARAGHDRRSIVIALGGGVIGDLAGFVAAVFFRGVPFVQIPTTILAQVDSSVGGKTGINLSEGKNLIGSFHQPRLVIVDPDTLHTLPSREFREGFAEAIKHAAIRDASMIEEIARLDPSSTEVPAGLIARNLAIKARIVEEDETETSGTRALLNFGHTIGHGIEAAVPYGEMLHGEAISLGLRAALHLSRKKAGLDAATESSILNLLDRFGLPLVLGGEITTAAILERLGRDKKFDSGRIRFVLLRRAGEAFLSKEVQQSDLVEAIESLRTPVSAGYIDGTSTMRE